MRAGIFLAIFGSLLLVLVLAIPVRLGPPTPRDPRPALTADPRCFVLAYPGGDSAYMPRIVRLESAYAPFVVPPNSWYSAQTIPFTSEMVGWRPWGTDSLDISWYHGPRIRLPARGDSVAGKVVPTGVGSVMEGLLVWRRTPVRAQRIPC